MKKLYPKGEFARNVLTLMTGTSIAQAIPVAISPILTRIYSPEDFGAFALYIGIVAILSVFSTARYELAIMLPEKDDDAYAILVLSTLISISISLVLLLIISLLNSQIANFLGNKNISSFLFLIPFSILLTGMYNSFYYWNNRKKRFGQLATNKVIQSCTAAGANIGMGYAGYGAGGLILGGVVGQAVGFFDLAKKTFISEINSSRKLDFKKVRELMWMYIKFPKYDLPSSIIYALYANMALVFFSKYFEATVAGFYFFANRIIKVPFSFFISAVSDVYFQKLSAKMNKEEIYIDINSFSLKILKLTLMPFLFAVYSSYYYVELIFGAEWKELYIYIYIFSTPAYMGLLIAPYGHVLKIINSQEISMQLHLLKLMLLVCYFTSYFFVSYSLISFLFIYAIIDSSFHVFNGMVIDKVINNRSLGINSIKIALLFLLLFLNYIIIF